MEILMIKFHRFCPLHLVVLIKQKYLSLVTRQNHTLNIEKIITPQFQNAFRMRLANTWNKICVGEIWEKIS